MRQLARQLRQHHASHAPPLAMPGMIGVALRSMLKTDAPLYLQSPCRRTTTALAAGLRAALQLARFHHAAAARLAILQRSRKLLAELVRNDNLDCEVAEVGVLYAYRKAVKQAADERHHAALLDRLGIEVQRLHGDDVETMSRR